MNNFFSCKCHFLEEAFHFMAVYGLHAGFVCFGSRALETEYLAHMKINSS